MQFDVLHFLFELQYNWWGFIFMFAKIYFKGKFMACFVFIAVSLDGYIAKKDGSIDWLNEIPNPDGNDYGYSEFMKKIDAVIMGRNTFEKVLTFGAWPYDKPVFVLSRTLKLIDDHLSGKVKLTNKSIKELAAELESRGLKNLYIDGGLTIQSFLKEDLIDEMIITKIPVLLGDGIPLFGETGTETKFDLLSSNSFGNGFVQDHYKRDMFKNE